MLLCLLTGGGGLPHLRSRWGYPIQLMGGTPSQDWMGEGYPIPGSDGGSQVQMVGYPGVPQPGSGMEYPQIQTWDGVPILNQLDGVSPCLDLGWVPPCRLDGVNPACVDRHTDSCQNITFPRTSYASGNNVHVNLK